MLYHLCFNKLSANGFFFVVVVFAKRIPFAHLLYSVLQRRFSSILIILSEVQGAKANGSFSTLAVNRRMSTNKQSDVAGEPALKVTGMAP